MLDRWRAEFPHALRAIGAEIIGSAAASQGLALLVARPGAVETGAAISALREAGALDARSVEIGAHASRFDASGLRGRAV
jgi:hypothetical protein